MMIDAHSLFGDETSEYDAYDRRRPLMDLNFKSDTRSRRP